MSKILYSATVTPDLAQKIVRIPSHKTLDLFVSQPYHMSSASDHQMIEWIEAKKTDKQRDLWTLRRYRVLGNQDKGIDENSPVEFDNILKNICFFDALHYCAQQQQAQKIQDLAPLDSRHLLRLYPKIILVQEAAERSSQIFDCESGLPIPCAEGAIIAEKRHL